MAHPGFLRLQPQLHGMDSVSYIRTSESVFTKIMTHKVYFR